MVEAVTSVVSCMVVKELSSQAFSITLAHLTDLIRRPHPDMASKSIQEELSDIVPTAQLHIIQSVLYDFEWLRTDSKTVDALCERLTELAQSIHGHAKHVQLAIDEWNQLYFRTWRTLDVSTHMKALRSDVAQLHQTFEVLKNLLPSCLNLSAARRVLTSSCAPK